MPRLARSFPVIGFLCVGSVACRQPSAVPSPARSPLALAIDSVAERFFALQGVPGMGIVVVQGPEVIYQRGFGFADVAAQRPFTAATEFYIASTTKSFTGLAAALLAERGAWDLDAPLSRYLPGVALRPPLAADSISIRSLLAHTHGIANGGPLSMRLAYTGDLPTSADRINALQQHRAASSGHAYAYGNIGYNVAAMAMDSLTHTPWQETLARELFTPLGMAHTSAYISRVPPEQMAQPYLIGSNGFTLLRLGKTDANMQSAGGLVTTLADMGTWLTVHINGGRLHGRQILPAHAVAETHRNQVPSPINSRGYFQQVGYGFGWQIVLLGDDTLLNHGGGFPGYATHMSFMPDRHAGVAVMANESELGPPLVDLLAVAVYDVIRGRGTIAADSLATIKALFDERRAQVAADRARRAARPQVLPFPLDAYVGAFTNPNWGTLELALVEGKLLARMGVAQSDVEVFDGAKNQLRVELFGSGDVVTVIMEGERAQALEVGGNRFARRP